MMRKIWVYAARGLLIISLILSTGCAPKPKDALSDAEAAIAEAEATSAAQTHPNLYLQAKQFLDQGREYEANLQYNLARSEYEAAVKVARIAISLSGKDEARPPGCPLCPEVETDSCCMELELCNAEEKRLKKRLANCGKGGVRTRVIREPCQESQARVVDRLLLGTLLLEPPSGIVKGQSDYKIRVKYKRARLEESGAMGTRIENDYRILLDIRGVEPPEVEASSPTADFEPLDAHGGEWLLPVSVPEGTKGPVKVTVLAILRNTRTEKEQELPAYTVTIPDLTTCPECPQCPKVQVEEEPVKPGPKSDWPMRIILLVAGIAVGLIAGILMSGRKGKGGSSIKV